MDGAGLDRRVILVDGANVVGSRPDRWWRDRAGAARRLVGGIRAAVASGSLGGPVIVVLEGSARTGNPADVHHDVEVVHAPLSGDDCLVDLARARSGVEVVVVTADRELRRRLAAVGAASVGTGWLMERLLPPDKPLRAAAPKRDGADRR